MVELTALIFRMLRGCKSALFLHLGNDKRLFELRLPKLANQFMLYTTLNLKVQYGVAVENRFLNARHVPGHVSRHDRARSSRVPLLCAVKKLLYSQS